MKPIFAVVVASAVACGCFSTSMSGAKPKPKLVEMRKDTELAEAVQQAQDSIQTFIDRLKHPRPGDHFAMQARFRARMNFEHMWVDHISYDGTLFHGKLADDPAVVKVLRKGESVNFPKSAVSDWLIINGDKREGGFAEAVLKKKTGQ